MSAYDDARALILLADYAGVDASGKVNAIGAAFNVTALDHRGQTPPHYVIVFVSVPRSYVGQDFSVVIELRRADLNQTVTLPTPAGQAEALRIQQVARPEMPMVAPGTLLPADLDSRVQYVLAFPNGLSLQAGVTYRWRVEVEGHSKPDWEAPFSVLAPVPPPIFGGPSAPPDPALPSL